MLISIGQLLAQKINTGISFDILNAPWIFVQVQKFYAIFGSFKSANYFMCMQLKEYPVEACKLRLSLLNLSNNSLSGLPPELGKVYLL